MNCQKIPAGITQARIDAETGLLATPKNRNTVTEVFKMGSLPPMEDAVAIDQSDTTSTQENPYDGF